LYSNFERSNSSWLLVVAAVAGGSAGLMTDHRLIFLSAVFAFLALVCYAAKEFVYPLIHRSLLRNRPVDVFFNITSRDRFVLGYAAQDMLEHQTVELAVPAHTNDLYLQLLLNVRTSFFQTSFELDFSGTLTEKPLIKHWFLPFVEIGRGEKHPGPDHPQYDQNHYVDHHKNYHIVDSAVRPKGSKITYGFKIETRSPGRYQASIVLVADGVESTSSSLTLFVESPAVTSVRCVTHRDCFISPVLAS
jgi:hypothetical protein